MRPRRYVKRQSESIAAEWLESRILAEVDEREADRVVDAVRDDGRPEVAPAGEVQSAEQQAADPCDSF